MRLWSSRLRTKCWARDKASDGSPQGSAKKQLKGEADDFVKGALERSETYENKKCEKRLAEQKEKHEKEQEAVHSGQEEKSERTGENEGGIGEANSPQVVEEPTQESSPDDGSVPVS
jgi:hypothetical protein